MIAWAQTKARWSESTQAQVVHEFLMKEKLFGRLVAFAKTRR